MLNWKAFKKLLPKNILEKIGNYTISYHNWRLLNYEFGQLNSIKKRKPLDKDDQPIPWYTYPSYEYLKQFDFSEKNIFEYGSGNSSIFWAKRSKKVISIEDDKEWYQIVKINILKNQDIYFAQKREEYVNLIGRFPINFDVIVIDGKYRYDCATKSITKLSSGGMIILDNSDWHPKSCQFLRENDLIQVDFSGFGPINGYTWTTSIFFDRNFGFKTFETNQPVHSIGSLKQYGDET